MAQATTWPLWWVGPQNMEGRASRTAITLYIKKEHKPSVLPIGLPMSVGELKYKLVWGWVFDSCNTHWFWVLKKSDSKNRHSGRYFKKFKEMLGAEGGGGRSGI
jgi:hypothetical protein